MIEDGFEDKFGNSLLPNEHIIWAGTPNLNKKFTDSDIFLIPFSLFWFLFSLFWEYSALLGLINYIRFESHKEVIEILPFPFVGLVFVLIGYYLLFGRFTYKRRKNNNTFYALSNSRVLILIKDKLTSININTLKKIEIYRKKNKIGSIILGSSVISKKISSKQKYYENTGLDFFTNDFINGGYYVLNDIDNAEDVKKLIIELTNGIFGKG